MNLPQARTMNIVVQDLGKELLVYDLLTNQAYNLNQTSKIVFNACNGKTSFDELKRKYQFTDDLIHFALDELRNCKLIESEAVNHFGGLSRREVIRKIGLASMIALPVISSMIAPQAAAAASTVNQCQATNCVDRNPNCNNGSPCSALRADFVCCAALNTCSCAPASVCASNGGQVCP